MIFRLNPDLSGRSLVCGQVLLPFYPGTSTSLTKSAGELDRMDTLKSSFSRIQPRLLFNHRDRRSLRSSSC